MRTRVKVCGITRLEDAQTAVDQGVDALGFMFYEASPRWIPPADAGTLQRGLPATVCRVGVFVDPEESLVRQAIREAGINVLQFHGEEDPGFCRSFGLPVLKAFRVRDEQSLSRTEPYDLETWLLDAYTPGAHGGTGTAFDWELARPAVLSGRAVYLAGGLHAGNVSQAVKGLRPHGLDVSSGVEVSPGIKDAGKIADFMAAVRRADFEMENPLQSSDKERS